MITAEAFDQRRRVVPWTSPHEVEQDLVLARLIAEVAMAAALIDVCAEATQPQRRWRRVLSSSKGTASDILGAWRHPLRGAGSHSGAARRSIVPQPMLKDKILAARRSHPAASPAWIAGHTGASRSYVNAVLRQDRRTRGGR